MSYFGIPLRNGVPIGLGSIAGFGVAPAFDPSELFAAGEQGAWYDFSDFSTLFTDSAGTTPVTAVEQFVGLMLDKSKGLVLGPELVTNGDFSGGTTGWTFYQSTLSAVSGKLRVTALSGAPGAYQSISIVSGRTYEITFDIDVGTVGTGAYFVGNIGLGGTYTISASGKQTFRFLSTTTNAAFLFYIHRNSGATPGQYFDLDNVSVKELAGNHATSTGTKRPKLAARYNLLTYTEQFDNGAWAKNAVTAANTTATTDPLGGNTAEKFASNTAASVDHTADQTVASTATTVFSLYAKAAEYNRIAIGRTGSPPIGKIFELTGEGSAHDLGPTSWSGWSSASAGNFSITLVGNGWYRISITVPATTAGRNDIYLIANGGNERTFAAATGSGVYIWGADLRPADQATGLIGPIYQRVVDAATYDAVGFLPYLVADGVDDAMNTGNIVPGTDKAQVFAGMRKLSDSSAQIMCEFSASVGSNNGSFNLVIPSGSPAQGIGFRSKGTVEVSADTAANAYPPPTTRVISGLGDIAGDSCILRVNGAQAATSSADQGTGDYLTYPLYLFGRGGTSLYFRGWMYGLIIRFGPNLSTSQIEATEAWVNQRTGAF
jgi:hypothetical protein